MACEWAACWGGETSNDWCSSLAVDDLGLCLKHREEIVGQQQVVKAR